MGRLKAPLNAPTDPKSGAVAWPMSLHVHLLGSPDRGGYHVAPRPESLPVDWGAHFDRGAPRTLEIGFNRGVFLRGLARAQPDRDHIGIEVRRRYVYYTTEQVVAAGLRNVQVVWGDGRLIGPALFGVGSLADIFINFPDPWWKRRHAKRRLVDVGFGADLARWLAPDGAIWVKSDVPMIADEIGQALEAHTDLLCPGRVFDAEALPWTYREGRSIEQGLSIDRRRYARR